MRTRSSRFFVVLLHLVGCQHSYLPSPMLGVQPWPIVLESLRIDEINENEPIWIQDPSDGTCFGPTATFTECGDATLWFVTKKARRKVKMGVLGVDEEGLRDYDGYMFQVVDRDESVLQTQTEARSFWRRRPRQKQECLVVNKDEQVKVETCSKTKASKAWSVDEDGVFRSLQDNQVCLYRAEGAKVGIMPCDAIGVNGDTNGNHLTKLSLVRYRAVSVASIGGNVSLPKIKDKKHGKSKKNKQQDAIRGDDSVTRTPSENLPSSRDKAHSHYVYEPAMHPELKLKSTLLFSKRDLSERKEAKEITTGSPFEILRDSNPILLAGGTTAKALKFSKKTSLTHPEAHVEDIALKMRRMQPHPYIQNAKNGIWTDPQTGLNYPTDLSLYLGHDRNERGRHTLTGVGQYRKGFVVKVYGVAYYVSKRDVLADPLFEPYAMMSADELRKRPDFYEILRHLPSRKNPEYGRFERTIIIKTNMQLAAETIRSSLQADWKMLTEEAKHTLITSSLQARPATADMLKLIQSPENPSRCSCSQVAPAEYQADPSCCARGTELAFTWLSSGDLEVRLNGHEMEVFPRPDIAEGIFFEYLRFDDPISPEFRDRVVDGFPFLLAPLAQIKGVNLGAPKESDSSKSGKAMLRMISNLAETVATQTVTFATFLQHGMSEMANHASQSAKWASEALINGGKDLDKRRDLFIHQVMAAPDVLMNIISREKDPMQTVSEWVASNFTPTPEVVLPTRRPSQGRLFGYPLSQWFGEVYYAPDEIGPMVINPTMNLTRKIFLTLVHLYLLLLLIVSFPGSYISRRTKRRSCRGNPDSDSDSTDDNEQHRLVPRKHTRTGILLTQARKVLRAQEEEETPLKKKSLSYYL